MGVAIVALIAAGAVQAQPASPPSAVSEGTGSGSGSSGMAPQQGTGSGATQHSPGANRPEASGGPPAGQTPLNRDYGRETRPEGQTMDRSNPGSGTRTPD
jgi:hypothetical protein